MSKGWYSAQELAGLPGMPSTDSAVIRAAKKNLWVSRRKLRGKGFEYPLECLPKITQEALADSALKQAVQAISGEIHEETLQQAETAPANPASAVRNAPAVQPRPVESEGRAALREKASRGDRGIVLQLLSDEVTTESDRAQAHAAQMVLDRLSKLQADAGCSLKSACTTLIQAARAGLVADVMVSMLRASRDGRGRPSPDGLPSPRSLERWVADTARGASLVPRKVQKDMEVKPWYGLLMALRQRPQGSSYTWITEQIEKQWDPAWGDKAPSYDAVRRVCIEKLSAIDQMKGRYTGSQLRSHRHYRPRTADGMVPWQEVHADGWNSHFTAPHPITGEYVTLEIWHFHDVATRFVPPPGIGLTETYEVVTAGLERAVRVGGMLAVLQTDSTKVVKNSPRFTADEFVSLADRAGFVVVHPKEVGNSQANGIAENFNTSYLDKVSRELATYQASDMDSLTFKRVKKITAKMAKAASTGDLIERDRLKLEAQRMGKGHVFTSFDEACAWVLAKIDAYNDRPHRSLPKVRDPASGKLRHQTPRECMQMHIADGWEPVMLSEEHLVDLFRPHVRCQVTREAVSPIGKGQRYYHPELGHWNDKWVMVAVDPMDWRQVHVKTLEGEPILVADLVKASGYHAQSLYEMAEEKRAKAQLKRLGKKVDAAEARMTPVVEMESASAVIAGRVINPGEILAARVPREAVPEVLDVTPLPSTIKRITPAPTPGPRVRSRSDMPIEEVAAEWAEVERRLQAGEPVSEQDRNFYQRWPGSGQGRVWFKRQGNGV